MAVGGGRILGAVLVIATLGTAVAVIISRDYELEMTQAVRDGDVAKVQDLLREDPALSRAKVMPQGSRTGRMQTQWDGQYIITDAVRGFDDRTAILDALLASGADLTVRLRGRTLLHDAVSAGNLKSVTWLLDHDADANARNECEGCPERGQMPLHEAQRLNDIEIIELLLARGAEIGAVDEAGRSALHMVAERGSVEAARALCGRGADPQLKDRRGRTPHDVAVEVDRAGRQTVHTEILGPGELAAWLRPDGPCDELAALVRFNGGSAAPDDRSLAILRRFACERGHTNSCAAR